MSGISSRDINELHPCVARGCRELIRRAAELRLAPVGINQTYRDAEHQDWLFSQGRTRPGAIVTNARGGHSIHQYRLAFDFHRNISGKAFADRTVEERAFWETVGRTWVEMGGVWGGNFTRFIDRPHCEYTGGLTLSDLRAGQTLPRNAKMPWEEEAKKLRKKNEPEANAHLRLNGVFIENAAFLHNDRAMGPIRLIGEALGATVDWDETTRTVTVEGF